MKKILVVVSILLATITAKAEYLNWQVGNSMTINGTTYSSGSASDQYNAVRLYATNGSSTQYYSIYDAPGTYSTLLADGWAVEGATYYIELLNYDNASTYKHLANTSGTTYAELSGAISSGALSAQGMTAIWTGAAVVTTPEPTSGLLLLMGFAMLGLKRKKEV